MGLWVIKPLIKVIKSLSKKVVKLPEKLVATELLSADGFNKENQGIGFFFRIFGVYKVTHVVLLFLEHVAACLSTFLTVNKVRCPKSLLKSLESPRAKHSVYVSILL